MKSVLLMFFLTSLLPCFARLGETVEQSIARYGAPDSFRQTFSPDSKNLEFTVSDARHADAFKIVAGFYKRSMRFPFRSGNRALLQRASKGVEMACSRRRRVPVDIR